MYRSVALLCGIVLTTGSLTASPPAIHAAQAAAVDPWIARMAKSLFDPQRAAGTPVQLDLPKKEWMVLPSSGSLLLMLASRKGDAVVLVERSALRLALKPADITDVFAQIEIDAIKEGQPKAAEFQSKVLDDG